MLIDNIAYNYNTSSGKLVNNRLSSITDAVAGVPAAVNLKNTTYQYDAIGNLTNEKVSATPDTTRVFDWNVYGKLKQVTKDGQPLVSYTYDATGNRVSKTNGTVTTWYVRDAQGNVLGIYDNAGSVSNWREQHLYGSDRLGIWRPDINLAVANGTSVWDTIGKKFYEIKNHLGNVLAVITDKQRPISGGYSAEIISAQDYYAFGGEMTDRKHRMAGSSLHRHGFNGKENDNDVKGPGNQQDYGMRIYDPRIARFLSVDPITSQYPELTPYQFASNTPIQATDLDGLEAKPINNGAVEGQQETTYGQKYFPSSLGIPQEVKTAAQWYWHNGGIKNIGGKVSIAGWYTENQYSRILSPIAVQLAGYLDMHVGAVVDRANWSAKQKANVQGSELGKFMSRGFGDKLMPFLGRLASKHVADQAFAVSGRVDFAPINIEDMMGVTAIFKSFAKLAVKSASSQSLIQLNRTAGNLFRDQLADGLRAEGRTVYTEVYKKKPIRETLHGFRCLAKWSEFRRNRNQGWRFSLFVASKIKGCLA